MYQTIAFTGHRPNKLGGYDDQTFSKLVALAERIIDQYQPKVVISGMALGWDQAVAQAAINKGVQFIAAVPFKGQEAQWPVQSQERYRQLLTKAQEVVVVCEGGYSAQKMQRRNEWMVDHADFVVALWDGTSGGTANCVQYCKRTGKHGVNVWPMWKRS